MTLGHMGESFYTIGFAAAVTVALLFVLRGLDRVTAPEHRLRVDLEKGHVASSMLHAGDVLAIFMVSASVVGNCVHHESLVTDAMWATIFGLAATVLYYATSRLGMRVLLQAQLKEQVAAGNVAAGIAASGHAIATGIIVARSIGGSDLVSLGLSLAFFGIAQASMHLLVGLFRWLTPYDDSEEVLGGNVAAALSYAGVTIAVGIIVGRAVEGTFTGWASSLRGYAIALGYGFTLYVVRQFVVQTVILGRAPTLRRGALDRGIATEKNVGMAALEAVAYVATALVVLRVG